MAEARQRGSGSKDFLCEGLCALELGGRFRHLPGRCRCDLLAHRDDAGRHPRGHRCCDRSGVGPDRALDRGPAWTGERQHGSPGGGRQIHHCREYRAQERDWRPRSRACGLQAECVGDGEAGGRACRGRETGDG